MSKLPYNIGCILTTVFIMVVMIDPTNTIFRLKDIVFVIVVLYNVLFFKPDISKIPYILMMFCAIAIPWITSTMRMVPCDFEYVVASFKAIAPLVLLLWVRNYDFVKLSRMPVIFCCFLAFVSYCFVVSNPLIEDAVWIFMQNTGEPVLISRRSILGVQILTFYLKSCVSFLLVMAYYMYFVLTDKKINIFNILFLLTIVAYFLVSGTRSTMLVPFFLFVVIATRAYKDSKYMKYFMYPIIVLVAIVFVVILVAAATEINEYSNSVKYGHIGSYIDLFDENYSYLILGQGPGTSFYSEGFGKFVYQTEWSYLDMIRWYGVFSWVIIYVFAKPLGTFWRMRNQDGLAYCMFWGYMAYLVIAGTNPLLMSSTGMIILLMAYSFEDKLKSNYITATQTGIFN